MNLTRTSIASIWSICETDTFDATEKHPPLQYDSRMVGQRMVDQADGSSTDDWSNIPPTKK